MKTLHVFYEDQLVGQLLRDADLVFSFEYAEEWIRSPKSFALSLAMPLHEKKFGNRLALSFFENLLPEGEVKENIQRHQHIGGVFDFLAKYGKDCAGAVVVTEDPAYVRSVDLGKVAAFDIGIVYQALDDKASVADAIADLNPGYLSLAGAQDKFPVIIRDGKFFLPTQGAPTTHIVKVPIQHSGIKESVFNEYYCMELARAIGLKVPLCRILAGKYPLFIVDRYDRYTDKQGHVHRLHQQDLCQAQGFTSENKYEDQGGPTLKQNYELILQHIPVKKRLESVQAFLDWIGFNLLIGNNDSHSKNLSLLLTDGSPEIAPLYDLICTAIYPKLKKSFSFAIGEQADFTRLARKHLEQLDHQLGLKMGTFSARLIDLKHRIFMEKDLLASKIMDEHPDASIPERISTLIADRDKSLKMQGVS